MTLKVSVSRILLSLAFLILSHADPKMIRVTKELQGTITKSSVEGWHVSGTKSTPENTSICGNDSLLGGFNVFGKDSAIEKQFFSKVDHSELFISFDIFSFNSVGGKFKLFWR